MSKERIPKESDAPPKGFEESPTGHHYVQKKAAISDDMAKVIGFGVVALLSGGTGATFREMLSSDHDECATEAELLSYKADTDKKIEAISDDVSEMHDLFNTVFEVKVTPRGGVP